MRRITTPEDDAGVYRVNFRQGGELNQTHPFTVVWVDRWSGQIKEVRDPARFSMGQTFTTWMWPLHTGEAFGATGRFLWFVAGLMPSLLYASGLLCWLHRRGHLRDRPVDFAALRLCLHRLGGRAYDVGSKGLAVAAHAAAKASRRVWSMKPGNAELSAWLRRIPVLRSDRFERWLRQTFAPGRKP